MTLRFHRQLYRGTAVDEAVKRFAPFCACVLREEPSHWVVELTAMASVDERRVAGELANYALGVTIQQGGVVA